MTNTTSLQRFAAPARTDTDLSDADDGPDAPQPNPVDADLHALFEAWSRWSRTRRFFAPPPPAGTILGKLSGKTRPFTGAPDAECNMDLAALHLAILGQPRDALDTQVFWAYYGERAANIKQSAHALGIGRAHFYRLLKAFCTRVRAVSRDIAQHHQALRDTLPHAPHQRGADGL